MNISYKAVLALSICFCVIDSMGQVAKNIIVEHFTNTRCSVCNSRNPGFYENLAKQDGVLHISYHPSRPYNSCELHLHNPAENDSRTKYYNVYGGTPRLVIQGSPIAATSNYGDASLFEMHKNQDALVSINIDQFKLNDDSISVKVTITNEAAIEQPTAKLFVGLAEEIINFEARNGEKQHFDVFRKAFNSTEGELIRLEKAAGTTYEINYTTNVHPEWDLNEMYVFTILQEEDTKAVIQSQAAEAGKYSTVGISGEAPTGINISPNPVNHYFEIGISNNKNSILSIYDVTGKLMLNATFTNQMDVDISTFTNGLYLVKIENGNEKHIKKLLKK